MTLLPSSPAHIANDRAALNAILRTDFNSFIRKVFLSLNPGSRFLPNWHIEAIAWHLEQVRAGNIKRLIINMPPRSLKSISASVAFPAFVHGHNPKQNIVCVSYGQDLAVNLQNDYRTIVSLPWYKELFPHTTISPQKDTETEVRLTQRGMRYATSIGGTLTGRGADIVVIDDPLKPIDAISETKRSSVNEWFSSTLVSRLNDKKTGAIIIVTQRVHADDLVGHLLERSGDQWTVLDLPAIAFAASRIAIGPDRFHVREADSVLHPERESRDILESVRHELGSEAFAAQYQQCPVPAGGNMFRREWLHRYDEVPKPERPRIFQSWDTASKTGLTNDYSVCTTWLVVDGHYYLLDVFRKKLEFPALKAKAIELANAWRAHRVLVEDTGIGTGLIAELKLAKISAIGIRPELSKEERASIQTAKFESGRVLLPSKASWLDEVEAELLAFPAARHDDQVDSIMQMLGYTISDIRFTCFTYDAKPPNHGLWRRY